MEDIVRIPPEKFGGAIKRVAKEQVRLKYENMIDEELGYVISVVDVDVAPVGRILPGDRLRRDAARSIRSKTYF